MRFDHAPALGRSVIVAIVPSQRDGPSMTSPMAARVVGQEDRSIGHLDVDGEVCADMLVR
jgi:hypothetical protein